MQKIGLLVLLVGIAKPVFSQIDTDRPAYTNTPSTVPAKTLQLEGGLHGVLDFPTSSSLTQSWTLPSTMVRFGVSKTTELRLELPSVSVYREVRKDTIRSEGWDLDNLSLGLKSIIYSGQKFSISSITTIRFLEQSDAWLVTPITAELRLGLPMSYTLNENAAIAGSVVIQFRQVFSYTAYSVLYGRYVKPNLWVQAEYVSSGINLGLGAVDNLYWTHDANFSAQLTISDHIKTDITLGSRLLSQLSRIDLFDNPNLRIQTGLAYAFHKE
jgi:hypothetical protein